MPAAVAGGGLAPHLGAGAAARRGGATVLTPRARLRRADEKATRLQEMVQELSEALYNVKREQEYMDVRERTHRASACPPRAELAAGRYR